MKILMRIVPIVLVVVIAVVTLSVANKNEARPEGDASAPPTVHLSPSPSPTPEEPEDSPEPSPTVYDGPVSPFTGLPADEDTAGRRPYAIMLNNLKVALPQVGVSGADVIFEIPVEGGITRMMALFQDISGLEQIGSIRSARPYFVSIALGYESVYIHAGGSDDAYATLKSSGITRLDGVNGSKQDIFFRDAARRRQMGYEHSLVTSGALIEKYIPIYGFNMSLSDDFDSGLHFTDEAVPAQWPDALSLKVSFSRSKTTTFSYAADEGHYAVSQYGGTYKDGVTGGQVAVENVLALRTGIQNIPGDTAGRLTATVTGSGTGTFYCGGKYTDIKWSRPSMKSPYTFTLEDGTELSLARGKTYICIIPSSASIELG